MNPAIGECFPLLPLKEKKIKNVKQEHKDETTEEERASFSASSDDGLKNCCFFLSLQQLSSFVTPAIFKPGPKLFKEENIWIPDKSARE